jgi:hypothetical protein
LESARHRSHRRILKSDLPISDEEIADTTIRLLHFHAAHPDLAEALTLWMADESECQRMYPEAAAIFQRELPKF